MSFRDWMKELDLICYSNYGMSIHDLPDMCFRDAYDGGNYRLSSFTTNSAPSMTLRDAWSSRAPVHNTGAFSNRLT